MVVRSNMLRAKPTCYVHHYMNIAFKYRWKLEGNLYMLYTGLLSPYYFWQTIAWWLYCINTVDDHNIVPLFLLYGILGRF